MATTKKTSAAAAAKKAAAAATKAAKAPRNQNATEKPAADFEPVAETENLSAAGKLAVQRAQEAKEREAEDLAAAESGKTLTLRQVRLLITRDNSKTTIDVFEYEQPIYELMHSIENVDILGERDVDVVDWAPETAYDTLLRKFGKNGREAVIRTYPSEAILAKEVGYRYSQSKAGRKRDRSGGGSMVLDYSKGEAAVQAASGARAARIVATH